MPFLLMYSVASINSGFRQVNPSLSKMFSFDLGTETKNNEPKIPKTSNVSLENQLEQLKDLFDKGLIPEEVYIKKVSDLL